MSTRRLFYSNVGAPSAAFVRATAGSYALIGGISSFTRADAATCAEQINSDGKSVTVVTAGTLRDSHFVFSTKLNAFVRTVLLEASRQTLIVHPNDLSNGAYTKRGTAAAALTATGPDGNANAASAVTGLGAQGVNDIFRGVGAGYGASTRFEPVFWMQKITATGIIKIANPQGDGNTIGSWTIDLSKMSTNWELITRFHPAVTIAVEFISNGAGAGGCWFSASVGGPVAVNIAANNSQAGVTFPRQPLYYEANSQLTQAVDALSFVGTSVFGAVAQTLFTHFYDESTGLWADAVTPYTGGAAITPSVDKAYSDIVVLRGTLTVAQARAAIGGTLA